MAVVDVASVVASVAGPPPSAAVALSKCVNVRTTAACACALWHASAMGPGWVWLQPVCASTASAVRRPVQENACVCGMAAGFAQKAGAEATAGTYGPD